jgi:glycine dehydrogenase subunit 2
VVGYQVANLKSNAQGMVDIAELERMVDEDTAALMLTNPSTIGVFESEIHKIADILHAKGALLYMDGANMNALVGKTRPGDFGVDVMHLNLHKTFSTPHGGGGPGRGRWRARRFWSRSCRRRWWLRAPTARSASTTTARRASAACAFYGNFGMFVRALAYILANGPDGLRQTTEDAVLNANYIRAKLEGTFELPFKTPDAARGGLLRPLQAKNGVKTGDMGKRLIDYGFHAYTVSFPMIVPGAMMIEPTESESREELDLLIDALKQIAQEATENPELVQTAPHNTRLQRLDETAAARKPVLRWKAPAAADEVTVDSAAKEW